MHCVRLSYSFARSGSPGVRLGSTPSTASSSPDGPPSPGQQTAADAHARPALRVPAPSLAASTSTADSPASLPSSPAVHRRSGPLIIDDDNAPSDSERQALERELRELEAEEEEARREAARRDAIASASTSRHAVGDARRGRGSLRGRRHEGRPAGSTRWSMDEREEFAETVRHGLTWDSWPVSGHRLGGGGAIPRWHPAFRWSSERDEVCSSVAAGLDSDDDDEIPAAALARGGLLGPMAEQMLMVGAPLGGRLGGAAALMMMMGEGGAGRGEDTDVEELALMRHLSHIDRDFTAEVCTVVFFVLTLLTIVAVSCTGL